MTGSIFIEARPLRVLGAPLPAQHLYLVQRDDIGAEYVLNATASRALPLFGATLEVEVNRPITTSNDARGSDTPAERLSTELAFDLGTDAAWALMVKYAREIDAADYGYRTFSTNSNAFVGAMLTAAGGEPLAMLPEGLRASAAVGYTSFERLLDDIRPPEDGSLRGTHFADVLDGIQVGEVIFGFGGDDVLRAGRGDDLVYGGTGDDVLMGGAGADHLRGGRGRDTLRADDPAAPQAAPGAGLDRLSGGAGSDLLHGSAGRDRIAGDGGHDRLWGGGGADALAGGPGNDRLDGGPGNDTLRGGSGINVLAGGPGADVFVFAAQEGGVHRVLDFRDGTDLLRIEAPAGTGWDALGVSAFGAGGRHTRIDLDGLEVVLIDVEADLLGAADVRFSADLLVFG